MSTVKMTDDSMSENMKNEWLNEHRVYLMDHIDVRGDLLSLLQQNNILTVRQKQDMTQRKQASDGTAIKYLIEHLTKKTVKEFKLFLQILERDGQGDMFKRCEEEKSQSRGVAEGTCTQDENNAGNQMETEDQWRKLLKEHRLDLVERIDPEHGNFYDNCQFITTNMRQTWQKGNETASVASQVEELLDFMVRRSNGDFVILCKALKDSDQGSVVSEFFPKTAELLALSPNRDPNQGHDEVDTSSDNNASASAADPYGKRSRTNSHEKKTGRQLGPSNVKTLFDYTS